MACPQPEPQGDDRSDRCPTPVPAVDRLGTCNGVIQLVSRRSAQGCPASTSTHTHGSQWRARLDRAGSTHHAESSQTPRTPIRLACDYREWQHDKLVNNRILNIETEWKFNNYREPELLCFPGKSRSISRPQSGKQNLAGPAQGAEIRAHRSLQSSRASAPCKPETMRENLFSS